MGFAALSYGPATSMDKIDFKKKRSTLYGAPKGFGGPTIPTILPDAGSICGNGR
jgi:hypothetical protein